MEREPDLLTLRRMDGFVVGHFSVRGFHTRSVLRAVEDDKRGYPQYGGLEEHEDSVRRLVRVRMESPWDKFLMTQRRLLRARSKGWLARALVRALPRESREQLVSIVSEDRRLAEQGLLELKSDADRSYYKHIDALVPEDRRERVRAELRQMEWLLERQKRRNALLYGPGGDPTS